MLTLRIRPLTLSAMLSSSLIFAVLVMTQPVGAESVVGSGVAGALGVDGAAGENGTDGGDGGSIIDSSGPVDPTNRTMLFGGRGGRGGRGGLPNGNGGNGGDGGSAAAESLSNQTAGHASADAQATGGQAGLGGTADVSGAGIGGNAGQAGNADATAIVSNTGGGGTATARATGGNGGPASGAGLRGSDGGGATARSRVNVTASGFANAEVIGGSGGGGLLGADGGRGADAALGNDSAVVVTSGTNEALRIDQTARAGRGGFGNGGIGGDGGDAATQSSNVGNAGDSLQIRLFSAGGQAGDTSNGGTAGVAGSATSDANASFDGAVFISAGSVGGNGGSTTGEPGVASDGGSASASAMGTSLADGARVSVSASASGGNGGTGSGVGSRSGDGAIGGVVSANAVATATGEAVVSGFSGGGEGGTGLLGADAGDGGSATLDNAVSAIGGATDLTQTARGGRGGRGALGGPGVSSAGRGGDASSILETTNAIGNVDLEVRAMGGSGGDVSGANVVAGGGGTGHASGVATAVGDIRMVVDATAGAAGQSGSIGLPGVAGSQATLGPVSGVSTGGGRVEVFGSIRTGSGSGGGSGAEATLMDAVDGATTGTLILHQTAWAGSAGDAGFPFGAGPAARGGDATSRLTRSVDAQSLTLDLRSIAGDSSGTDDLGESVAGGDAMTFVDGLNRAGEVILEYGARGGIGAIPTSSGTAGGVGGSATSIVRATTQGDGRAITIRPGSGASGSTVGGLGGGTGIGTGLSGGDGGVAVTRVEAIAEGDSAVDIEARVRGGAGAAGSFEGIGGNGATAEAVASGQNAGSSSVQVLAEATGGFGGNGRGIGGGAGGGDGGTATASAYGASTGGGDVTVTARVIGGAGFVDGVSGSTDLTDAVSGLTAGRLRLVQESTGGDRLSGIAGDATSSLSWVDADAAALEIESNANGGHGRESGTASASASGFGRGDVQVVARATGGSGAGDAGAGGVATVDSVYAESTGGGLVRAEADVHGGNGSTTGTFAREPGGGAGADALVQDTVAGVTTGSLQLLQTATGGDAGDYGAGGTGGAAGNATNRLNRAVSAADLQVTLASVAGHGSNQLVLAPGATDGGDGLIEAVLSNDRGAVNVLANASGGAGGSGQSGEQSGRGGNATLNVTATSSGAGHDVTVGGDIFQFFGARGGNSRASRPRRGTTGIPASGGDADSRSVGIALGDSLVTVRDIARGGEGFDGGNATSYARGENLGSLAVAVSSEASGGRTTGGVGKAGDAHAVAIGNSTAGDVAVRAVARGGMRSGATATPLPAAANTLAIAHVDAVGRSGFAEAEASGWSGEIGTSGFRTSALARASVGSSAQVEASVGRSARAALDSNESVSAHVNGLTAREGEFARVGFNLVMTQESVGESLHAEAMISPNSFFGGIDSLDGVFVSFLDLRIDEPDFEETLFRIENGGELLLERRLTDVDEARVFFSTVLNLGDFDDGLFFFGINLRFTMESTSGTAGSGLGTYFAVGTVAVPEPGTGILLISGLIILAGRRGRRVGRPRPIESH